MTDKIDWSRSRITALDDVKRLDDFDIRKSLSLISEYTIKLREVCQKKIDRITKNRVANVLVIILAMVVGMLVYLALSFKIVSDQQEYEPFIGAITAFFALLFGWFATDFAFRRNRDEYDADELSFILQRLVSLASQTYEHSGLDVADRFELQLRLAEAEAALRLYRDLFRRRKDDGWKGG